jgi:ribosomal protein L31
MVLSGLLHWLTLQSIYLARIEIVQNPPQYPYVKNEVDVISTISFSTIALIFVVLSSIFAIIAVVVTGLRRYKHPNIPVAGSCSAAISAACHPMWTGQRRHLGKLKLSEGFVDGVKYLSLTEEVVATPMNGHVDGEQAV